MIYKSILVRFRTSSYRINLSEVLKCVMQTGYAGDVASERHMFYEGSFEFQYWMLYGDL